MAPIVIYLALIFAVTAQPGLDESQRMSVPPPPINWLAHIKKERKIIKIIDDNIASLCSIIGMCKDQLRSTNDDKLLRFYGDSYYNALKHIEHCNETRRHAQERIKRIEEMEAVMRKR